MKKHNFELHIISSNNINIGFCYSVVDLENTLFNRFFLKEKKERKGYMFEFGFFVFTFVYLHVPESR
jgi:hypothetical protein